MNRRTLTFLLLLTLPVLAMAQKAAPALKHMAPLIGTWKIDQEQMNPQGQWTKPANHPEWTFEWALGGQAVIDHWTSKSLDPATNDSIPVHGVNLRVYDPKTEKWNVSWVESLNRKYVSYEGTSSSEEFKMEGANISGREVRIRFFNFKPNSFQWEQAWTFDQGKNWVVVGRMVGTRVAPR